LRRITEFADRTGSPRPILFDLSPLQFKGRIFANGGADYVRRVLAALEPQAGDRLVFLLDATKTLPPDCARWKDRPHLEYSRPQEIGDHLAGGRFGTFFSGMPYNYGTVRAPADVRLVYVIHGLRTLECPDDRYRIRFLDSFGDRTKERVKKLLVPGREAAKDERRFRTLVESLTPASRLVAVSNHTAGVLSNWFPQVASRLDCLYSPAEPVGMVPKRLPLAARDGKILLLNADRWVKNAPRAVRAFDALVRREPEWGRQHRMTVVGGLPETFRRGLRHPEAFEFLPYLSGDELALRMRTAWALFYPSLNEGFGYPPLDALRVGTPVLASRLPPLVEVGGDAVLTFDPYSGSDMVGAWKEIEANWDNWSRRGPDREAQVRARQEADLATLCKLILS